MALTLCKYYLRTGDLFELGSVSSELLMCGEGVHSILLFPLVARCLERIDVCMWHIFAFMSVVVTGGMDCRCLCMGRMSVSSCNCSVVVSCVHPVAVLNTALYIIYFCSSRLQGTSTHMEEDYCRAYHMTAL